MALCTWGWRRRRMAARAIRWRTRSPPGFSAAPGLRCEGKGCPARVTRTTTSGAQLLKLGLHLSNFTYGVPATELGAKIGDIAATADAAGFDRLSVMDHYFQIPGVGPAENEMFEAYGVLGFIAAKTTRIKLGVLATGV